ncbi:hypothetical protein [Flavobacterium sp.]|uniref:hypothetical protein n=1 Tax=Flavobacterium sp. TaxID=239 RepID=UPI003529175C
MKTNLPNLSKIPSFFMLGILSLFVVSCGSYNNSSYYDNDGVYSSSEPSSVEMQSNNGAKYATRFKVMQSEYQDEYNYFTDVDNYSSEMQNDSVVTVYKNSYAGNNQYAGWGSNDHDVTINYYNNGWGGYYNPYWYGGYYSPYWYNSWYGPNWNWGFGWNSWYGAGWSSYWGWGGYYSPYWYGNYYGGWGYPYYGNHNYYGRNVVYANGGRGGRPHPNYAGRASSSRSNANVVSRGNSTRGTITRNNSTVRNNSNSRTRINTTTRGNANPRIRTNTNNSTPRTYSPSRNNSYSSPRSSGGSFGGSRSSGGGSFGGGRSGGRGR